MIKRLFSVLTFLAVLSVAAIPWFAGRYAQESYEQALLDLEQQGIHVVDTHYRRGWLNSEVETDLSWATGLAQNTEAWRLRATSHIAHGPLSWVDLSRGQIQPLAAHAETRLALIEGDGEPQTMGPLLRSHIDLDGNLHLLLLPGKGAPLHGDGRAFRTDDIQGDIRIDAQRDHIQANIRIARLALSEGGVPLLDLRNLAVTADTAKGASGLRLGRVTLNLDEARFAYSEPAGPLVARGLAMQMESGADGESIWAEAVYRCKEMRNDELWLEAAEIKIRANSLSAPILARLDRSLSDLVNAGGSGQYQAFALMAVLSANLNQLLQDNPQVTVERLHLATEEGILEGRLRLGVSGWKATYILNPDRWLEVLDGSAELAIPEALLRRMVAANIRGQIKRESSSNPPSSEPLEPRIEAEAQRRIDQLLRQELAVRDGERIVIRARIGAGLLTVNGKTVPFPTGTAF